MLCNNSSQAHSSLLQIWDAMLLWCCYLHMGSMSLAKQRKHRTAQQANPARLSVCKSLAPSCCRLSKHTNCSKGARAVLSVCTDGLWKHDHIRGGQHEPLLKVCFNNTFYPNFLSFEKTQFQVYISSQSRKGPSNCMVFSKRSCTV